MINSIILRLISQKKDLVRYICYVKHIRIATDSIMLWFKAKRSYRSNSTSLFKRNSSRRTTGGYIAVGVHSYSSNSIGNFRIVFVRLIKSRNFWRYFIIFKGIKLLFVTKILPRGTIWKITLPLSMVFIEFVTILFPWPV